MKQIFNWEKKEESPQTLKEQARDLAMLWLSLPMLVVVLLWETLALLLNLLERMPIDRTLYRELFLTKISIWMLSFKKNVIKTKNWIMTKFGRQ